jgi:seryl-tRNA synthetase
VRNAPTVSSRRHRKPTMLDIRLFREQPDFVREGMAKVGESPQVVDRVLALDSDWRGLTAEAEELKAERNRGSKQVAALPAGPEREALVAHMRSIGGRISDLDGRSSAVRVELDELMLNVPNLPHQRAPVGADESGNVVVRTWGEPREFAHPARAHWEIGPELGLLDFDRGVKLSGSRFYVLLGQGAHLQRALISWMLDLHVQQHGYTEVYPPFVVRADCLVGTGNLPKFAGNLYHDVEDDVWLIPTAEVPLTNLHRDEILAEDELPKRYTAYSACFRRERMHAGTDVRGIKRGHQFDKVELVRYCTPEVSDDELEKLIADAEDVCRRLELPYRVVEMCTGDLSFTACRKFDIEVWAPGCEEWLEVSSCSGFRDFQARRAGIRYRRSDGTVEHVHTLNGSGLALPRVMIAILENYQQADGSIEVPREVRPYMGGLGRIERT